MLPRPLRTFVDRPAARLAAVAMGAIVVAGCGGTELDVEPTFDGNWSVSSLTLDGRMIEVADAGLKIEIDTAEAALRGTTSCGRLLGSYTLESSNEDEGDASMTIPSPAPSESCAALDQERHESLATALESVTQWRRDGNSLQLLGPDSTSVELRPAG